MRRSSSPLAELMIWWRESGLAPGRVAPREVVPKLFPDYPATLGALAFGFFEKPPFWGAVQGRSGRLSDVKRFVYRALPLDLDALSDGSGRPWKVLGEEWWEAGYSTQDQAF